LQLVLFVGICLILVSASSGCGWQQNIGYVPPLEITGDVARPLVIREPAEYEAGSVYILSDHGMHRQNNEGYHGIFRYEDMVVPFITVKGKGATTP